MWKLGTGGSNRWRYSEVFGDNDQQVMAGYNKKRSGLGLGRLQGL